MDLRTGEIKDENEMTIDQLVHSIKVFEKDMTSKQKTKKQVSLKDHKSKLGKLLTRQRKQKGYSQMTRNQQRNLRHRLKGK